MRCPEPQVSLGRAGRPRACPTHANLAKSAKVKGTALNRLTAEQMMAYIKQESAVEGEQHKKEFKGADKELATQVDWLLELSAADLAATESPPGEES